ncbi:hypothetical protein [Curtobacterium flaccumfaciens]|uniref:hypothetical protein n=1 Tax=Curtobacterium flaccumfaciens TaxID=2035 RepID=UPI001BDF244D|nr:hypothetical protein [Curtobacterium flaccumfaciens]MBT1633777.1 hypothetical protein [Curtobacterium flaccumfaciens pv. oortii]MCX2845581.1 hypothetical protein [Curtobacterium flaccumfaciens pv. oortii]
MTTTDPARHHVEVATQSLADASRFTPEDPARASFLAEAQVHALLALVEEQRTANQIAADPSIDFEYPANVKHKLVRRLGLE